MKIIKFCIRYKYILTLVVFAVYFTWGENNFFKNRELRKQIEELEAELQRYHLMIANTKTKKTSINTKEDEEEYFRKHHHLKKEHEDIFRIIYHNK